MKSFQAFYQYFIKHFLKARSASSTQFLTSRVHSTVIQTWREARLGTSAIKPKQMRWAGLLSAMVVTDLRRALCAQHTVSPPWDIINNTAVWRLNQLQGDIFPAFNLSVSRNYEKFPWGEKYLHRYSLCVYTWEVLPNILTGRKILRIGSVPPFSIKTKIHPHMWLIHFSGIHPALS